MKRLGFFQKIRVLYKQILYVLLVVLLATSTTVSAFAAETFNTNPISSSYKEPSHVTAAGGSLWYDEESSTSPYSNNYIGNMTISGAITDHTVSPPSGATSFTITSLTTGPDGNVWFNGITNSSSVYAGSLNISTGAVSFYASPVPSYGSPGNIVTGSDGNLWYTVKSAYASSDSYLIKVNPSTGVSSTGHTFDSYVELSSLTSGPDGNLWLTDDYYNKVDAIAISSGNALASYTIPTSSSYASGIITGPDGNLWLTEAGKITKLTTSGTFTEYTPASGVQPGDLTVGSDGAVWFVDAGSSTFKIGRITSSGSITEYTTPSGTSEIFYGMALGPDNAMWFGYSSSSGTAYGLGRLGY
jgi:streptogramin lyase